MADIIVKSFDYDKKLEDGSLVTRSIVKAVSSARPSHKQIERLATEWHCSSAEISFKKSEFSNAFEVLKPRGETLLVIPDDPDDE